VAALVAELAMAHVCPNHSCSDLAVLIHVDADLLDPLLILESLTNERLVVHATRATRARLESKPRVDAA